MAVHNLLIRLWNSKFNALFFGVFCKQFGNIRGEESSVRQIESPGKWCGMTFRMTILQELPSKPHLGFVVIDCKVEVLLPRHLHGGRERAALQN